MIASTITSKGQVTIPKEIRDKFHLKTHDRLLFKPEAGRIIIKPVAGTIFDIKRAFPEAEAVRNTRKTIAYKY